VPNQQVTRSVGERDGEEECAGFNEGTSVTRCRYADRDAWARRAKSAPSRRCFSARPLTSGVRLSGGIEDRAAADQAVHCAATEERGRRRRSASMLTTAMAAIISCVAIASQVGFTPIDSSHAGTLTAV